MDRAVGYGTYRFPSLQLPRKRCESLIVGQSVGTTIIVRACPTLSVRVQCRRQLVGGNARESDVAAAVAASKSLVCGTDDGRAPHKATLHAGSESLPICVKLNIIARCTLWLGSSSRGSVMPRKKTCSKTSMCSGPSNAGIASGLGFAT